MDKWLSVTKPASERTSHKKTSNKTRYNPYGDRPGIIILDASKHTKQVEKCVQPDISEIIRLISSPESPIRPQLPSPSICSIHCQTNRILSRIPIFTNVPVRAGIIIRLLKFLEHRHIEHIVSLASGHQRSERRSGVKTSFVEDRSRKLKEQREEMSTEAMVLNNVQVYINGYLSETTDIEMKRIVTHAGGRVMLIHLPSNTTIHR